LIVNGVDPRRILLMTFSRRAASEMSRRVESICAKMLGAKAGAMTEAIWAGTFHAVGARLIREYAEQIGLQPNFTIHDREDSADLMNLFRHQLGFSQTESRFPTKGTCLSIYSRAVNVEMPLEAVLQGISRGALAGRSSCGRCSRAMWRPSRRKACSITTTCCSTGHR
jgi:DNA helicase-2/ATP-dependent DNA helicase PcrA